ncbi:MAG: phosphotransferase, partial [Rhodothermia bacterium]
KGPSGWSVWQSSPVGSCALWWRWQVGAGLQGGKNLEGRYHEVMYDDLVSDPDVTIRHLASQIDLDFPPEMLDFAAGKTMSGTSLSAKSAWLPPTKGLRDWRSQMGERDVELFECIAGDLLAEFGFERRFESFDRDVEEEASALIEWFDSKRGAPPKTARAGVSLVISKSAPRRASAGVTHHDEEIISRDKALPGLGTVIDSRQLLARIRPHLFSQVDDLRAVYVRYKANTNCLVGYEAETGGKTVWMYAKAHRFDEGVKLRKAAEKAPEPTTIGPGNIVLDDIGVVVRLFPFDDKLPALGRFQEDAYRKVIQRLFGESDDFSEAGFETIRYKPERRLVTKLSVSGRAFAAVKFLTPAGFDRVRNFNRSVANLNMVRTPRLIAHSKRMRAVAHEWQDGRVAAEAIREPDFELSQMDSIAATLSEVHAQPARGLPTVLPVQTIRELEAASTSIRAVAPGLQAKFDRLVAAVSEQIMGVPMELSFIHGDFYAKQILLNDGEAILIDFDEAAIGNRHLDLGNFVAHLQRDYLRGQISQEQVAERQFRFLDSYRRIDGSIDDHLVAAYTAAGLLKLAPHPFRFREPEWFEQTEAILDLAHAAVPAAKAQSKSSSPSSDGAGNRRTERLLGTALDNEPMERRLNTALGHTGDDEYRLDQIRLVRHKPGRRCLIRYDLHKASEPERPLTVLGKIRGKGLDRTTFELTEALYRDGFGPDAPDHIRVPKPLACIPELNMWVQEHVESETLTTSLLRNPTPEIGERAAEALAKLQRLGPRVDRRHDMADELSILKMRLREVRFKRPELDESLKYLKRACERLAETATEGPYTLVHRDFYPDQLLFAGHTTYVIDFDLISMGDPALDAGNFIAHVRELALRSRGDLWAFESVVEAFREAYLERAGEATRHNIHVYTWLSTARHVWISTNIAERKSVTEPILELCLKACLGACDEPAVEPLQIEESMF